jgi:hypothetical protein
LENCWECGTGIAFTGIPDTAIYDSRLLRLDQPNLIRFEPLTSTYTLIIYPKFWFKDLTVGVFAYTGIDSDTVTEQLNRIELSLDRGGL